MSTSQCAKRVLLGILLISACGLATELIAQAASPGGKSSNQTPPASQGQTPPAASSAPQSPSGQTSTSLAGTILAYDTLKAIGTNIAARIVEINAQRTTRGEQAIDHVCVTATPVNASNNQAIYSFLYNMVQLILENYKKALDFIKTEQVTFPEAQQPHYVFTGAETLGDFANALSTLLSLLRTSTTLTETSTATEPLAIYPSLFNELSRQKPRIGVTFIDISFDASVVLNDPGSLQNKLFTAARIRALAEHYVTNNSKAPDTAKLLSLNVAYDNFITNATTLPLGNMIVLDYLHTDLATPGHYLLYVTNSYALDLTRTKSNPILDIFLDGPRISYAGGSGVTFFLYGASSELIAAGRFDSYFAYKKLKQTPGTYIANDGK